jgi:hypothetical protein
MKGKFAFLSIWIIEIKNYLLRKFNTPKRVVTKTIKKYGITVEDLRQELKLLQDNKMCATEKNDKNIINILYELKVLWGAEQSVYKDLLIGRQDIYNYICFYKAK